MSDTPLVPSAKLSALGRSLAVAIRRKGQDAAHQATKRAIGRDGKVKLDRGDAVGGKLPPGAGGTGHGAGAEPPLGSPGTDGEGLHSLADGTRYWAPLAASGSLPLDPTTTEGDLLYRREHDVAAVKIGFIGDSITEGVFTTAPPPSVVADLLTGHGLTVTTDNQGHGGAKTADWVPGAGSGYLTTAKAAFASAGVRLVHVMLGTNDAGVSVSAATWRANMIALLDDLVTSGYLPVVSGATGTDESPVNAFLVQYAAEIPTLCNGVTVWRGDSAGYPYFIAHPPAVDGVHPDTTQAALLAGLWAAVLRPLALALAGPLALARLPIGDEGDVATVVSGLPAWAPPVAGRGSAWSLLTDGAGNLIVAGGDVVMIETYR